MTEAELTPNLSAGLAELSNRYHSSSSTEAIRK